MPTTASYSANASTKVTSPSPLPVNRRFLESIVQYNGMRALPGRSLVPSQQIVAVTADRYFAGETDGHS